MKTVTHTEELLMWLVFLFVTGLGLDYYLLVTQDAINSKTEAAILIFIAKQFAKSNLGFYLRVLVIILSPLLFKSMLSQDENQNRNSRINKRWGMLFFVGFLINAYFLVSVAQYATMLIRWIYPSTLALVVILSALVMQSLQFSSQYKKHHFESKKLKNNDSLHIRVGNNYFGKGWINITNPFRGTLIIGSSGSGKSASLGNAFLEQFIEKDYCGICYDFKFPTLAEVINTALHRKKNGKKIDYFILNFRDIALSHRCNPLAPENISSLAHAEEFARTIINNLDTTTIKHQEFFSNSATAWLASLIWFFRTEHPNFCTLPHIINTILYRNYAHVISMLESNTQSGDMIRSIATAMENKAEKQIAGVIASLQMLVTRINSPEIVWILTGNDFNLNINDPKNPKLLCVGNDPVLTDAFRPVISLIFAVALKQMNQQSKQKSFVLLDEAPTIYIPKFEVIPATARSNRIAPVYMAQDFTQMYDMFGREKAAVIISNLSNQFYGKVSAVQTARMVSEMVGREERSITSYSQGSSRGSFGNKNLSYNKNTSIQEKLIAKPEDIMRLSPGEFIGQTVEGSAPYFWAQTKKIKWATNYRIKPFTSFKNQLLQVMEDQFSKVRKQVDQIVQQYPNRYN